MQSVYSANPADLANRTYCKKRFLVNLTVTPVIWLHVIQNNLDLTQQIEPYWHHSAAIYWYKKRLHHTSSESSLLLTNIYFLELLFLLLLLFKQRCSIFFFLEREQVFQTADILNQTVIIFVCLSVWGKFRCGHFKYNFNQ